MAKFISKAEQIEMEQKFSEAFVNWRSDFIGFILMPNQIVNDKSMTDGEFRFYCQLFTLADQHRGVLYHSNDTLADTMNCSVNNVKHFLKLLKKRKAIEVLSVGVHSKRVICLTPQRLL